VETDDGLIDEDEGIRPDTTAEKLSGLSPAFVHGDGTVTARGTRRSRTARR